MSDGSESESSMMSVPDGSQPPWEPEYIDINEGIGSGDDDDDEFDYEAEEPPPTRSSAIQAAATSTHLSANSASNADRQVPLRPLVLL